MLLLHLQSAECLYLSGNSQEAEELFDRVLANAKTNTDKASVYRSKVTLSQNIGKGKETIKQGMAGLKLLGKKIPLEPNSFLILKEIFKVKWYIRGRKPEELLFLPPMTDHAKQMMSDILFYMAPAAYFCNRKKLLSLVMLKVISLSLRYGNTNAAPLGYAIYGFIISALLKEYKSGYAFGTMSLKMCQLKKDLSLTTQCNFILGTFINHWINHLKTSSPLLIEGYEAGLESGNYAFASYCAGYHIVIKVSKGDSLSDVQKQAETYMTLLQQLQLEDIYLGITSIHRMILCLKGLTKGNSNFNDETFNESDFSRKISLEEKQFVLAIYYNWKLPLYYLFDEHLKGLETSKELAKKPDVMLGMLYLPHHNFYYSLILTALYSSSNFKKRCIYWWQLKKNQKQMKIWADHCPANFLNKYSLVAAEMSQLKGDFIKAERLYTQAITAARESEFIHEEAFAHELTAKFYHKRCNEKSAKYHINQARSCYHAWGATAKVAHLEKTYPQYF
ncbi:MAG: hypothetical protein WC539_10980 [Nitrospirota bacterium]